MWNDSFDAFGQRLLSFRSIHIRVLLPGHAAELFCMTSTHQGSLLQINHSTYKVANLLWDSRYSPDGVWKLVQH